MSTANGITNGRNSQLSDNLKNQIENSKNLLKKIADNSRLVNQFKSESNILSPSDKK